MPDSTDKQLTGKLGEEIAADVLRQRGYAILATRYRTRYGEIDIVARDDDVLVFVEVKARQSSQCGTAAESVTVWKQRRIIAMARDYLGRLNRDDIPCRFDVVAIDGFGTSEATVRVITDAFVAD